MNTTKRTIKIRPRKLSLSASAPEKESVEYENDFFKWTRNQAKLLQKREFNKLDIDNLIEEIESLGRSEKRTLVSYLENFLMHMLKVRYQPEKRTTSWDNSIEVARHKAQKTLDENPSLKPKLKDIVKDAYYSARLLAATETNLDKKKFPEECPWSLIEIFPGLDKKYRF